MKKVFSVCVLCIFFPSLLNAMPDLGEDGLKGLTDKQKATLEKGEMVLVGSISGSETRTAFVEAAVVFEQPPSATYELLAKVEDQANYLSDLHSAKIIEKEAAEDNIEFVVKLFFLEFCYRVIHKFEKQNLYFEWTLDPTFNNSLRKLSGFWKFYPYKSGKTLGRYGTKLTVTVLIPEFIQDLAAKRKVPAAMGQVKKYVDSGGTYRKK